MALAISGENVHANLSFETIASELASWQCDVFSDASKTISFIKGSLETYNDALHNTLTSDKAYPKLKAEISSFISNLLSGKRIG
jgi:hypothetical protein